MRVERLKRRQQKGTMTLADGKVSQTGKVVFDAKQLSYDIDGQIIVSNFETTVLRGDKVGIVGPNGCGKTTLLKLLLGKLEPSTGSVKQGTNIEIAYFDQLRAQLDDDKTVMDVVGEGSQKVNVFGVEKHIISYLGEFLFSPERCRSPIRFLSGGEKNRLLLARLFTRNANVLVFDEPTNDLDIESLEMLEAFLVSYQGTLLIVSHDRVFLDNVTSSIWLYEGGGKFNEYVGGYSDAYNESQTKRPQTNAKPKEKTKPQQKDKLSPDEKRELKRLPKKIDELEQAMASVEEKLAEPNLYESDNDKFLKLSKELKETEEMLEPLFERWQQLEDKS
jgi:ATP-binding cassette subfamily F protein uup